MTALHGIYAIVDPERSPDPLAFAGALLAAGIRLLQYRDKRGADRDMVVALHARCAPLGAKLIVNDDLDAALFADGVHLGQEDLQRTPIARARKILGARIIGVSAATPELAHTAQEEGADYLGAGPYRATRSKVTAREPLGPAGLRAIVQSVTIPVAAIGGIELGDVGDVRSTGAAMVAVISALSDVADPKAAAQALIARWEAR
jgi:thiamine-phosphate diphosphorylase